MIVNMELNMIIIILIKLQGVIIDSKHKTSYYIIIIKNHQESSSYDMCIIKNQTFTAGVLQHIHVFIMLHSTKKHKSIKYLMTIYYILHHMLIYTYI